MPKHFHQRNGFAQCETGFNNVKLPKVGSNAIVPVPVEAGPNKENQGVTNTLALPIDKMVYMCIYVCI
jgi:hypothetical protein